MRQKVKPEIKLVSQTRNGGILGELDQNSENNEGMSSRLRELLGDVVQGNTIRVKSVLKFRVLDYLRTTEEVKEAIERTLPNLKEDVKMSLIKPNSRALKMGYIWLIYLTQTMSRSGGSVAEFGKRYEIVRCHSSFSYGHQQTKGGEPYRRKEDICIKCEEKRLIKKDCLRPSVSCAMARAIRHTISETGGCTKA